MCEMHNAFFSLVDSKGLKAKIEYSFKNMEKAESEGTMTKTKYEKSDRGREIDRKIILDEEK